MQHGTGWRRQRLDHRDVKYQVHYGLAPSNSNLAFDLRPKMSPIVDQGQTNSCVACAICSTMEYLHRKEGLGDVTMSRLFVYWCARNLEGETEIDNGIEIRDGIKAAVTCGAPPESMWPFRKTLVRKRPINPAFEAAKKHMLVKYASVRNTSLPSILSCLKLGLPIVGGFSIFESIESEETRRSGYIPRPQPTERPCGEHGMVIVGYQPGPKRVILRNSWDESWGDKGYGYMDVDYVTNADLASDFWMLAVDT